MRVMQDRSVTVQVKAFSCVNTPSAPATGDGKRSRSEEELFVLPASSVCREPKAMHVSGFAGVVRSVSPGVTGVLPGQRVFGMIPFDGAQLLDSPAEITLSESEVAPLLAQVSFDTAASVVRNAVKAYTALSHLGRLSRDDTVMITGGLTPFAITCAQLAKQWGARVLLMTHEGSGSRAEKELLEKDGVRDCFDCLLDLSAGMNLLNQVKKETGGQGLQLIVDDWKAAWSPSFHDLVCVSGVGCRIVTTRFNLQIPESVSRQLFLKCASVSYLFEHVWTLSGHARGKYLHMLADIDSKLERKILSSNSPLTNGISQPFYYGAVFGNHALKLVAFVCLHVGVSSYESEECCTEIFNRACTRDPRKSGPVECAGEDGESGQSRP
ncbi:unnamed protein product [Notodromas monacha]|uniref:Enoyl reductase (ER) domain-containing protein n=1 Tax=Notodromas monacha TaxID=399045 RepID=A0A7R9BKL2_9CRUS|nr:unnamed protein product [Notodromas monacha]CAG0916374.1 unnamed protein product [Notodromas monacha]